MNCHPSPSWMASVVVLMVGRLVGNEIDEGTDAVTSKGMHWVSNSKNPHPGLGSRSPLHLAAANDGWSQYTPSVARASS